MRFKLKKFLAFEWLMFLIMGLFWAMAMALPLYLSGAFDNKSALPENVLIMCGPYLAYLFLRSLWLLGCSIVWAYLTSSFFFTSYGEKAFAEEWMRFVFFGLLWMACISVPMYLTGMFTEEHEMIRNGMILCSAYGFYLLAKMIVSFFKSINWAVLQVSEKDPVSRKKQKK